ncbi:MAG: thioredoxin domain-containing protein [Pseudomonadota bacterium]
MKNQEINPNRLIYEKSPYLLQHADNPVDWYPWGEEAFENARKEDRPILVSIGYSTCHWCHVMAEESFSDRGVAGIMNQYFTCIKIDREERPDLDKIYITAVSAMTGSAGWPLNVFLTPQDLKPFFGGTYFPRLPRPGIMAWPDLLVQIGKAWKNPEAREKILVSADTLTGMLRKHLSENQSSAPSEQPIHDSAMDEAFSVFQGSYDHDKGGFGRAPKFPSPATLNFLLSYAHGRKGHASGESAANMVLHTLRSMARGGIYDQLGGGFHRYSVDAGWHVPHFEKMLYDNAQLASTYLSAYQMSGEEFYRDVAEDTIQYVLREMTHPEGGFFSAQDADSLPGNPSGSASEERSEHQKVEGAYYVWEYDELQSILNPMSFSIFTYRYGIESDGNVAADPSGEFRNKNILFAGHTIEEMAEQFQRSETEIQWIMKEAGMVLLAKRSKRPKPHLDDKIILSWNGLMISTLAKAYQATGKQLYLDAAEKAADFIHTRLYDNHTRQLYRIWREGERKINGIASDYSFLIQGLIDLYESGFRYRRLEWAAILASELIRLFSDRGRGGLFMTREDHDRNLLMRIKEEGDSVLPAAGSIAALSLWKLSRYTGNGDFRSRAREIAKSALGNPNLHASAIPQMLVTLAAIASDPVQVVIAGEKTDPDTRELIQAVHRTNHPGKIVFLAEEDKGWKQVCAHDFLRNVKPVNGKPAAYMCVNQTCQKPVTDSGELAKMLIRTETKEPNKPVLL